MNSVQKFAPGQIVGGKYKIVATIGHGGMGSVYRVVQVFLNRELALKVLDSRKVSDDMQMRRFQIEAKAAYSLNHPNLVKVHDFGLLENDEPYLVMDLVDGVTLADFIREHGPLSPVEAARTFVQVCRGLDYAHDQSIIHRDMKPSNIMLVRDVEPGTTGSIKIVDFGIAKIASDEKGEIQALTRTGEIFGSPLYMSPEQCSGEPIDKRTDVYSVGCTLFEALTGTPPFVGANPLRTMMLHQTGEAPKLKEASMGTKFPAALEQIVQQMLRKSPYDRYQNLTDVARDLSKLFDKDGTEQLPKLVKAQQKAPRTVTISRANLIIALATTAVVTSLGTYGALQLTSVNASVPPVKEEPAPPPPPGPPKHDSLNEIGAGMDDTDAKAKKNQELSYAAFARATAIKSQIVEKNGVKVRQINFPDAPIGFVSNVIRQHDGVRFEEKRSAVKLLEFPVDVPLCLEVGGKLPDSFTNPKVLSLIGPTEFSSLWIHPAAERLTESVTDSYTTKETQHLIEILEIASKWTSLTDLEIDSIAINPQALALIKKIRGLSNLHVNYLHNSQRQLADADLLKRLRQFAIIGTPVTELLHAIAGSSKIEHLVMEGSDDGKHPEITVAALKGLSTCPNLAYLQFKPEKVTDEMVDQLLKMRALRTLYVKDSIISSDQIRKLLKVTNLKQLILSKRATYFQNSGVKIDDKRIYLKPDP